MNFDDDAPPDLIEVGGEIQDSEEGPSIKVPITIVTGEITDEYDEVRILTGWNRIPRCRKDDIIELHTYGSAWKKDCRYYEW